MRRKSVIEITKHVGLDASVDLRDFTTLESRLRARMEKDKDMYMFIQHRPDGSQKEITFVVSLHFFF